MDQLLLAGQSCSEAEWNLTPNGLQWKVNKKRKWTYDLGRSINLLSPKCQNKRVPRRSWVHLGEFHFAKGMNSLLKGKSKPWAKQRRQKEEMFRISGTKHSLFSREGIKSTFSTRFPKTDLPAMPWPHILAGLCQQLPWEWSQGRAEHRPGTIQPLNLAQESSGQRQQPNTYGTHWDTGCLLRSQWAPLPCGCSSLSEVG